ncbi:MAG: hypothetical protein WC111_03975 [Candidatus Cloacimonadaceae bacterium]|nr:hypothetical protein [Candidatus Cloacimonadota bacterium]MDD3534247.1 hypothetical protein [Candidatus Cloacimonadota bacterium]
MRLASSKAEGLETDQRRIGVQRPGQPVQQYLHATLPQSRMLFLLTRNQ